MIEEKHIIKKAVVEIYVSSAQSAMGLQNKALVFFKEKICPIIEKIVTKYSVEGETIRIDKLEIDLENFSPENSGEQALWKIEEQIEKKIIKIISEERKNDFSGEIVTAVKKIPKEKADEELFLHLLRTGTLPWWAKTDVPVSLEALAQKVLVQPAASFRKDLAAVIIIPAVRKRIANKLSVQSIEKIVALVCGRPDETLQYIKEFFTVAANDLTVSEKFRKSVYEFVLKYPASVGSDMKLFVSGFIKEKNDLTLAEKVYRLSSESSAIPAEGIAEIKQAIADTNEYFAGGIKKIFDVKDRKLFFEQKDAAPAKKKPMNEAGKELPDEIIKAGNKTEYSNLADVIEETGDYFIKNAGVIILVPYFPALFRELGLCDGKVFVSDDAKERAACLIQYLTTGSEEPFEEHEMVLNKILCGIEISEPLTLEFRISEKEKEECLGLLNAAAGNWTALKGTSGEGMRDAFFIRDGILEAQSNGWNLKIEKTTIDILVDKLPWGISILQMPWSKEMIFVEW